MIYKIEIIFKMRKQKKKFLLILNIKILYIYKHNHYIVYKLNKLFHI